MSSSSNNDQGASNLAKQTAVKTIGGNEASNMWRGRAGQATRRGPTRAWRRIHEQPIRAIPRLRDHQIRTPRRAVAPSPLVPDQQTAFFHTHHATPRLAAPRRDDTRQPTTERVAGSSSELMPLPLPLTPRPPAAMLLPVCSAAPTCSPLCPVRNKPPPRAAAAAAVVVLVVANASAWFGLVGFGR